MGRNLELSFGMSWGGLQARKCYSFDTSPLSGIKGGRDDAVTVGVIGSDGTELQKVDYQLRSDIDLPVLPDNPLTVGPGYARNPETLSPDGKTDQ